MHFRYIYIYILPYADVPLDRNILLNHPKCLYVYIAQVIYLLIYPLFHNLPKVSQISKKLLALNVYDITN